MNFFIRILFFFIPAITLNLRLIANLRLKDAVFQIYAFLRRYNLESPHMKLREYTQWRNHEKKFDVNELKKKYSKYDIIILKAKELNGKEDVVGGKLLKAFNYIKDKITKEGWKIKEANWEWNNEVLFYYVVEKKKLSKEIIHLGPPKKLIDYVKQFRKKWKNHKVMQNNYHVYVKLKRRYTDIKPFITNLLKDKYLKSLVKNIKAK